MVKLKENKCFFKHIKCMAKQENNVELTVLKSFSRVIKDNGLYMFFILGTCKKGAFIRAFMRGMKFPETPFSNVSDIKDVARVIEKITNETAVGKGLKSIHDMDKYERVTMDINHLLHYFIEVHGVPMVKLCELGEEIYSISCNKLFGDTIEDLAKQSELENQKIENPDALKAKLFCEYINRLSRGELKHDVPFDEFLRIHEKDFDRFGGLEWANENSENAVYLGETRDRADEFDDGHWENF